jgi:tetratricopeptide (TPR) repeat protein
VERRILLLLAVLLAAGAGAGRSAEGPATPLQQAVEAAESSLREGDAPAAEARSRTALIEGWLLLGRLAAAEDRMPEAAEAFRHAAQELAPAPAPRDLELAFALAAESLALREVDAAAGLFARVLEGRPIAQTHVLVGRAYRDFGAYDRARAELLAALRQDPRARRAHYYLGTVAVKEKGLGGLPEAVEQFGAELKVAPGDPLASLELGVALVESQRPAEALPALEAAARSGPAQARTLAYLGRALLRLDRPAEAAATLQRALQAAADQGANAPARLAIHMQLGQALSRLGRSEEAAAHFAESQRLSAEGTEAERDTLARYMADSADPEPPRPAGSRTLETAALSALAPPQRVELKQEARTAVARTYLNLGVLQAHAERFARAAELFEQAAAVDPELPQLQSSLGVAYFNARLFEKATGPLARALAEHPGDAALRRMLGLAWLNLQEYAKAAALLADDPQREADPSLQFAYGLALVKSDRGAEAEAVFSRLLSLHGDSPEVSVMLGQAHAQQGDFDSAIRTLKRAIELKADVAEANATLGVIYLKQGRLAEAEAALRAELRGHPADLQSMQNLAIVLESEQKADEARGLLREVLKSKPDLADARYLLGKILLAQGAAAEAAEQLEAAARLNPEDPGIHYQLGQAYQKLGRTELAQQQFDLFREIKARR